MFAQRMIFGSKICKRSPSCGGKSYAIAICPITGDKLIRLSKKNNPHLSLDGERGLSNKEQALFLLGTQ